MIWVISHSHCYLNVKRSPLSNKGPDMILAFSLYTIESDWTSICPFSIGYSQQLDTTFNWIGLDNIISSIIRID